MFQPHEKHVTLHLVPTTDKPMHIWFTNKQKTNWVFPIFAQQLEDDVHFFLTRLLEQGITHITCQFGTNKRITCSIETMDGYAMLYPHMIHYLQHA